MLEPSIMANGVWAAFGSKRKMEMIKVHKIYLHPETPKKGVQAE